MDYKCKFCEKTTGPDEGGCPAVYDPRTAADDYALCKACTREFTVVDAPDVRILTKQGMQKLDELRDGEPDVLVAIPHDVMKALNTVVTDDKSHTLYPSSVRVAKKWLQEQGCS